MSSQMLQNTSKRDHLIQVEKDIQSHWYESKVFESDPQDKPKYMATFPYPYMNGRLHLGHVFTISKADFAIAYKMMKGYNCLFPFAFHCTGMPIVAASNKLKNELQQFGYEKLVAMVNDVDAEKEESNVQQKSKVAAKQGNAKYQFQILASMGVDLKEIPKFADPKYWTEYFPPHAQSDLMKYGAHIDWRRQFITTSFNPHYDMFIRWQFNKLKKLEKIKFGERHTIWSILDNQPCMDHDRSQGEGVGITEYTGIKIKLETPNEALGKLLKDHQIDTKTINIYFIAATLRPETMYGQTNCFIGTKIEYSAHKVNSNSIYIMTPRSARNMAYQGQFETKGNVNEIFRINGSDLLGCALNAPLSHYKTIYMLPLQTVLDKGTGIVTSVPSDSPDDYIMCQELLKKSDYYKIKKEWVNEPITIIETPLSTNIAKYACEQFKIKSPNDAQQLIKAKELAYKQGFYSGTILVGEFKGQPVSEVKLKIRDQLIAKNDAFVYSEPESLVVSRSGDECIVNCCDQWYLDYGEEEWKQKTIKALEDLECYHGETRHLFLNTLNWLNQWACARGFGLGTELPWDKEFLVESLSDSTIYMAYYTISNELKNIPAEELRENMFEYLFGTEVQLEELQCRDQVKNRLREMKKSFEYYYPFDLRVSGKDLVPNHLTMCLYNHTALFNSKYWPKSIRSNGHLLLNSKKMSKSTGNFMTLCDSIQTFGSDATRITLADAGDLIEDANFMTNTANAIILKLFNLLEWTKEMIAKKDALRKEMNWIDSLFIHMIYSLCHQADNSYNQLMFRDALKYAFYECIDVRDWYINSCNLLGLELNAVILEYIELQCLIMAPISSHSSEHIWKLLGKSGFVVKQTFPLKEVDQSLVKQYNYLKSVIHSVRTQAAVDAKRQSKDSGKKVLNLFVQANYPKWQSDAIDVLKETFDGKFSDEEVKLLGKKGLLKNKKVMPFVQMIKVFNIN
eukprot:NODE_295_length_10520_cov_1.134344.p1 type:complete len:964 gc:universal NODE_295_length_10520_cov_1.134344:1495-4386(+)